MLAVIGRIIVILFIGGLVVFGAYYLGTRANLQPSSPSQPTSSPSASTTITPTTVTPITPTLKVPNDNGPDTVTQNYYNWYLDCTNQHLTGGNNGNKQVDCAFNKTGALTSDLETKLQQAKMYDPVLCAQNIPDKLTFDKSVITNDTATAEVHTIWGSSSPGNIQIGLLQANGLWKINSIDCNNTQSTTPFYSSDLDATFYIPSGWTVNVANRDPSAPPNTPTPCNPSSTEFYKNPSQCTDAANTFLIGINTSSKQSSWPNFDMSIDGPTEGLGGACPPEDFNYLTQTLTINNKPYAVKYGQNKTDSTYEDCFLFPTITESGTKSKWREFNVFFQAPNQVILDTMLGILQTAKFN